jgi:hypothetical protein
VVGLMRAMNLYVLRDPAGAPIPTVIDFILTVLTRYCSEHLNDTVEEAGYFIGAEEQAALNQMKQHSTGQN